MCRGLDDVGEFEEQQRWLAKLTGAVAQLSREPVPDLTALLQEENAVCS